jgi:predicted nucleotidyltransferase
MNVLNDKIWGSDNKIIPLVKEKLLTLAKKVMSEISSSVEVRHIYFTGSLATYKWTPISDIDLHIIVDILDKNCENTTKEYFDLISKMFNSQHNIFIKGYKVEVNIKDKENFFKDKAAYDLIKDVWVKEPSKITRDLDDSEVIHISKTYQKQIDDLIDKGESPEKAKKLKKEIKYLRTSGLEDGDGEYSIGNLVFKKLRNTGYLGKLFDYYNNVEDQNLSLENTKSKFYLFFNTSL